MISNDINWMKYIQAKYYMKRISYINSKMEPLKY